MAFNAEHQAEMQAEAEEARRNTEHIRHQILVMSGKGGVGKSSIAANLAVWLSMQGNKVGLLDVDIHGPSVPKLLGLEGRKPVSGPNGIAPIVFSESLHVMSIGFLIADQNEAVIWRGPMKHHLIRQFVCEVAWGELDYLIVDCPPGTGEEPLSIVQLLKKAEGAVVVTTPNQLAIADVKKCITFCRRLDLPVLGIIDNMDGFVCSHCNQRTDIFQAGGGERLATEFAAPYLGSVPIDPEMVWAADSGKPFIGTTRQTAGWRALRDVFKPLLALDKETGIHSKEHRTMRIAIPLFEGKLSQHFGHCEQFAIIDTDGQAGGIAKREDVTPPPHEPGVLPRWLAGMHVNVIIAGGMGQRAQQLFTQSGIEVVVGAGAESPESLVAAYLNRALKTGANLCNH
ncbi:MAG TPA: iron-sulfur cluster carrier protein MrpORP [Anaerohalosphaeraceae bacterium]|jgi:Mrp family chromosome partitioning ATPase/predicted Fe-Mo cluster-binding NifX family protein|nr:iron-sulfur cluster carrier protein MrpORP [Anaerohalosphaeraceae bacterium]HRT52176.1 iron-sulfur cluster carrier protein MrpORP [Anaerohalosphaeraceae bacterium]HRT88206.1 iron-sulfur cluster carrier protein MrpORP [Anaerohalosphaeraceae bacterium]